MGFIREVLRSLCDHMIDIGERELQVVEEHDLVRLEEWQIARATQHVE